MSSCDMLYIRIFERLGLRGRNLKSYKGVILVAFNESFILTCGTIELSVSFEERKGEQPMNVCFLVIPYENVYNDILERSFLAILNALASLIYLKMKYHNNACKLVVILANLRGDDLIHEAILKNPLAVALTSKRQKNETRQTVSMIDLDVREDKTLQDGKLG